MFVLASEMPPQILSGALQSGADGCLNKTMSVEPSLATNTFDPNTSTFR